MKNGVPTRTRYFFFCKTFEPRPLAVGVRARAHNLETFLDGGSAERLIAALLSSRELNFGNGCRRCRCRRGRVAAKHEAMAIEPATQKARV